jgi:dihydrolipoamide dehydrogenase
VDAERTELLVLGSGPAGWYCALEAARAGFRTALAEKAELGGTGFRWGCLPVKMGLDALRRALAARGTALISDPARPRPSLPAPPRRPLASLPSPSRLAEVERRLEEGLRSAGVKLLRGEASFLEAHTLAVGDLRVRAETVVIATGTRPAAPAGLTLDGERVLSHADLVRRGRAPRGEARLRRVAIVGADVEGAELACLLAGLGARVHLLEQEAEILPGQDRDLADPVQATLESLGVRLRLGARVAAVGPAARGPLAARGAVVALAGGETLEVERVLVTGLRAPNLPAGLGQAGVACTEDRIPVDAAFRTSAPGVYAIGDVNGLCGRANAAIQQGLLLPATLRGGPPPPAAYPAPPRALFTIPEIAGAGLQERELQARGIPYRSARVELADTWRGLSLADGLRPGFLKALAAPDGRLLGLWVCAENASELAAPFGLLLERGAGVEDIRRSLFIHPTLAEALLEAVRRL